MLQELIDRIENASNYRARDDGSGKGILLSLFDGIESHDDWVEATVEAVDKLLEF